MVEDPCKHENWFVNGHFQSHLVVIRTTTRELKLVCSCSPFFSESIRTPGESVKLREMPHTGVRMEACRRKKALRRWEADFFSTISPLLNTGWVPRLSFPALRAVFSTNHALLYTNPIVNLTGFPLVMTKSVDTDSVMVKSSNWCRIRQIKVVMFKQFFGTLFVDTSACTNCQ